MTKSKVEEKQTEEKQVKEDQGETKPIDTRLIICKVRPGCTYGAARANEPQKKAGELVEIETIEYEKVRHTLVSLDDEENEAKAANVPTEKIEANRAQMEALRAQFRDQHRVRREMEARRAVRVAEDQQKVADKLLKVDT